LVQFFDNNKETDSKTDEDGQEFQSVILEAVS